MRTHINILAAILFISLQTNAQTTEIKPKGVYKEISIERHNKAIERLHGTDTTSKRVIIDSVLNSPNYYNPPVLYALSKALFDAGRKYEAAFWFYVAQLRARYDANLCLDNSVKQAVAALNNEYGPAINQYAFSNIDSLEAAVTKVIEFVKNNEEAYDHRWINLHGMDAFLNPKNKNISQPPSMWAEIKKKTVEDYSNGFYEFVKRKKS